MDVNQYLGIFLDETNEHLQTLSDQLMILENEPENEDTINEIFRAAHSLKGMAGTMGYKRMQNLTHDMENVFSEVRNGKIKVDGHMVDILFQALDALEEYKDNISENQDEGTNDNEPIINALQAILNGEAGGGDAPAKKEEAKPADAAAALIAATYAEYELTDPHHPEYGKVLIGESRDDINCTLVVNYLFYRADNITPQ